MSLEYQPLNTYLNEIRLLSLQPSKNIDGPIACSLSTISLDDKPLFEALSYVWGGATATADIFVDGVAFSATTNLHDALKHIRPRTGDPRIMWIDAICINQNDDSERNHQVPLMQRIYSGAAAAVVWLGPSNVHIETLSSFMIARYSTMHGERWERLLSQGHDSIYGKVNLWLSLASAMLGYRLVCQAPYWTRMWTFQEYLLPRTDPAIYCGSVQLPRLSVIQHFMGDLNQKLLSWDISLRDTPEYQDLLRLHPYYFDSHGRVCDSTDGRNSIPDRYNASFELSVTYTLMETVGRQCKVPKDRFYALYGLFPKVQAACSPDYLKSDHQVVLEIASYILCEEPHNNGLHTLALREDRLSLDSEFPSWVPDFSGANDAHCSRRDLFSSLVHLEDSIYDSAAKQPPFPRVSADKTTLHISGLVAGTVTTILEFGVSEAVILEQLDQILNDIKNPQLASAWMALSTLPALVDRVHQAISAHHDPFAGDHLKIIAHHDKHHHDLAGESSRVAAHNDEKLDWWLNKTLYLAGKRLFFTNTGLFGIGGSLIEPGDSITFLQWQRMPILLREERDGDDEYRGTPRTFRVVGPAYVDGFMMNEWHDEELVKELASQTLTDFAIH